MFKRMLFELSRDRIDQPKVGHTPLAVSAVTPALLPVVPSVGCGLPGGGGGGLIILRDQPPKKAFLVSKERIQRSRD